MAVGRGWGEDGGAGGFCMGTFALNLGNSSCILLVSHICASNICVTQRKSFLKDTSHDRHSQWQGRWMDYISMSLTSCRGLDMPLEITENLHVLFLFKIMFSLNPAQII